MTGYVTAETAELKMKEYEAYRGYYCGLCLAAGKRLGQFSRLVLSYDLAFLALFLASLSENDDDFTAGRCFVHPVEPRAHVIENEFTDYAADMMAILAYHNLLDDWKDDRNALSLTLSKMLSGAYKSAASRYPSVCETVAGQIAVLSELERAKCASMDEAAEAFAVIMSRVFSEGPETGARREVLAEIGRHLGRWIYLKDAAADLEKDIKTGGYNPLVYRFGYEPGQDVAAFKERIEPDVKMVLESDLAAISKARDLLGVRRHEGILDNGIYFGLNRRTQHLFEGAARRRRGIENDPGIV